MNAIVLVCAPAFAALPVHVTGDGCPTGPEVEQALASMLSAAPGFSRHHSACVQHQAGRLHVELTDASGAILADAPMDVNVCDAGSCP